MRRGRLGEEYLYRDVYESLTHFIVALRVDIGRTFSSQKQKPVLVLSSRARLARRGEARVQVEGDVI